VITQFTTHESPSGASDARRTLIEVRKPLAPGYEAEVI
jgi:hypothetical protein